MKFLDIFSGIGGFRIGMEMAGHECVGHIEWDKFAQKSYMAMHNVKESEFIGWDIKKVRADELPRADVWCFGFPCQDISIAGKQEGFAGHRSSLFFAVTRLIRDLEEENRPSILFIENVKNLLSVNRGGDFLKLLIELDEIGYNAEWQLLNSKHFGVPQNRERVFIIGHLRGRGGRKVFPIGETDCVYNSTRENEEIHKIASCLTSGGNDKWNGDYIISKVPISMTQKNYKEVDIANTLTASGPSRGRGNYSPVNGVMQIGNCMPTKTRDNPNQGRIYDPQGISPCLNKMEGGGREPLVAIPVLTPDRLEKRQNGRRFKEDGEPMFTLTARDRHGVMINDWNMDKFAEMMASPPNPSKKLADYAVKNNFRIRRLTPRECFRLQGFTDEYFERAAAVNSDTQLYKQAGNSVTVNVIYEIAKRLGGNE